MQDSAGALREQVKVLKRLSRVFEAIYRLSVPERKMFEAPELCQGHLRSRLKIWGGLVKHPLAKRGMGR